MTSKSYDWDLRLFKISPKMAKYVIPSSDFAKYANRYYYENFIHFTAHEGTRKDTNKTRKPFFPNWKTPIIEIFYGKKSLSAKKELEARKMLFFQADNLYESEGIPFDKMKVLSKKSRTVPIRTQMVTRCHSIY